MKNLNYFFILLLIFLSGCQTREKIHFEAGTLRCEYLESPLGLDVPKPRLSWQMNQARQGARQTAYQVMVATSESKLLDGTPDLWDSGKTESGRSIQIEYQGKPLATGMKVFWKVKVWDDKSASSAWSPAAYWEMGLIKESDWQAKWIGAPESINNGNWKNPAPQFRKEVALTKKIIKARAYICGLGYYELYINGKKIGDHVLSPNQTNYDLRKSEKWDESRIGNMTSTVLYETHDITSALSTGANVFGVLLGNGWYFQADRPNDPMLSYNTPRLAAQFAIEYEDGTGELITTDNSWKTDVSPIIYNGLYTGEIYDARMEQKNWSGAGFDDSKWTNAEDVKAPAGKLQSQVSPPDRVTRTIQPVSVTERPNGAYRFDMGEMITGWARLKISGTKGTSINLRFIEELGPGYNQTDTYILKGDGVETWEPRFTFHGFRYVDVFGSPAVLTAENLEGKVVNTDIPSAGYFESSNKLLNKILDNYRRTQLGNVHGGLPSDCPHRERLGYTGDGQISARAAIYNFDLSQFYTKWLNDIHDAQNHETGYVPNTTPYQGGGGGTAWGAAYVIIPWYMYQYYGDVRILTDHYAGMKHWIEFMKSRLDKDGLLRNQGLGEWVPPELVELPADFVNSCYYSHCCTLMSAISRTLGHAADEEYFLALAGKAKTDINKAYFNNATSSYSVGKQGANAFPLGFGIAEKSEVNAVFEDLVKRVITDNKAHFDTGILGTPLLLEVLTELGRIDLAYTLMNQRDYPGFGYMIEKGATTIWETWLGDASHSHPMFGSVCAWFYQSLGGISPDPLLPGFKKIIIKPYPVSALSFVKCSYPSPYGNIVSNWKFEGDDFLMEVTIPCNTTASVYVFGEKTEAVTADGSSADNTIKKEGNDGQFTIYTIGSGSYRFVSKGARMMLKKTILPTPVIHPGDTLININDSVPLSIFTDVPGSKIHYTLDGTEPDTLSDQYKNRFYINKSVSVKAKTFFQGFKPSFTTTSKIEFIDININGLDLDYYSGSWKKLPDFSTLKVVKTGSATNFTLEKISAPQDQFALVFSGKIRIEKDGTYDFSLLSNDGSQLFLDNMIVIDHNGMHGADVEKTGKVTLSRGMHPIRLHYFQAGGGMFLNLKYSGPGIEKQIIPATVLLKR